MACAVYLGLVAGLSLAPSSAFPSSLTGIPGADKVVHFAMYGGLAAVLRWALAAGTAAPCRRRGVLLGAVAYGLLMEILQATVTHDMRGFGWGDIAANTTGALAFWTLTGRWLEGAFAQRRHQGPEHGRMK